LVVKVRRCGQQDLEAVLKQVPDQEIIDIRETNDLPA
jgi:hypothetical protein